MVNFELTAATLFYSSEKHLVLSHLRGTTAPTELELQELRNLRVWLWWWCCSNMMDSKFTHSEVIFISASPEPGTEEGEESSGEKEKQAEPSANSQNWR